MENPAKEYGLSWLSLIGQNFNNDRWTFNIITTIYYILTGGVFILGFLEPVLNFQGTEALAASFDLISNYFMFLSKITIYTLNKKSLQEIMEYHRFWPVNYCGEILKQKQLDIYKIVQTSFKYLIRCGLILLAYTFIPSLFATERRLPLPCYNIVDFVQSPFYEIIYFWLFVNGTFMVIFIISFDSVFIANITFGYCQIMMLKHELENLDFQNIDKEKEELTYSYKMKNCVDLHNRIIRFVRKVNDIYSNLILTEIFSSFLNMCMALYLIADANTKFTIVVRCGLTTIANVWLLFIFCTAGSMLTTQYESICSAIYSSNWYLCPSESKRIRNEVTLIMQISQNQLEIKAGGVFGLNMEAFASILRFTFTFYTLLKTVS